MDLLQATYRGARLSVLALSLACAGPVFAQSQPTPAALATAKELITVTGANVIFNPLIAGVVERFPRIKVVATTLRHVHSTNRHSWSAVASINGQIHVAPTCELDVYDRVGGGDGFASGLFYGLLTGEPPEECVKLGWAHGAMITAFPGDTTMATLEQVRAFAKGGSARIQR